MMENKNSLVHQKKFYEDTTPIGRAVLGLKNAWLTEISEEIDDPFDPFDVIDGYKYRRVVTRVDVSLKMSIPIREGEAYGKITDGFDPNKKCHIIIFQEVE
jgi:hypothetical protein